MLQYPFDPALLLQKKRSLKRELLQKSGLTQKKVAILSGSTIGEIKNMLELFLLDNGVQPQFYEGEYARFYEDLVFDNASLREFAPDFVYIHTSMRNIRTWPDANCSQEQVENIYQAELTHFTTAIDAALALNCPVIINNFDLPVWRTMGNRDGYDPTGRVAFVRRLNTALADYCNRNQNLYLNDLCYLQARHGMDTFSDPTAWYAYKYCCAVDCIPYLAHSVACIIKSLLGKNKKALALDLDNTLWGGVIGDDGAEGIVMGSESPEGMAFSEFQQYLKLLTLQGILLNVDSKNEKVNAEAGFKRADSVLHLDDFVCFEANWQPKNLNLANMAKVINILTDSFVFVDDNPAEREIIRREMPEVSVPELGNDPEHYISILDRCGFFETTALSADDRKRNTMYKQNAQRAQLEQSFGNYDDYLRSLDMTAAIVPFDEQHAERITQLINKTNQFNLTTRRYTAAEVETVMQDPNFITLSGRLTDKFGDNGITSILIASVNDNVANIDLWVMSCRVFKRKFEHAMFDCLVEECAQRGITTITGQYLPTAKNLLMKDFYGTIGFEMKQENDKGERTYAFAIPDQYQKLCDVIKVNE